ncbi:hypothetical protein CE167_07860 [Bifidobacterium breve]|nr:hypothetical protein CE167_07860 [Bifidobacterium breve]
MFVPFVFLRLVAYFGLPVIEHHRDQRFYREVHGAGHVDVVFINEPLQLQAVHDRDDGRAGRFGLFLVEVPSHFVGHVLHSLFEFVA